MSASYPPPANKSCRIWTERDDELPWFMADMLATAIRSEVLEAAIPPEEDAVGQSSSMAACLDSPRPRQYAQPWVRAVRYRQTKTAP